MDKRGKAWVWVLSIIGVVIVLPLLILFVMGGGSADEGLPENGPVFASAPLVRDFNSSFEVQWIVFDDGKLSKDAETSVYYSTLPFGEVTLNTAPEDTHYFLPVEGEPVKLRKSRGYSATLPPQGFETPGDLFMRAYYFGDDGNHYWSPQILIREVSQ